MARYGPRWPAGTFGGSKRSTGTRGGSMGWLQENGVVLGTFATTAVMLVGIWWRVLRSMHTDNREAWRSG